MKKYLTRRNIIIAVILVLVVGWVYQSKSKTKNGKEIKIVEVKRGTVIDSISVAGKIKADIQATLNFPATGRLVYLGVKEGDSVKKWQLLAYQDPGDLDTAVTKTYYAYLAADANAKEVEDNLKNKGASENYDEKNTRVTAQTARDTAYDAWLAAQRAVKNARLTAPFDGLVTSKTFDAVGDLVGVTDSITIVDPGSLYFEIEIDESDLGKVTLGQEVKIKLDAFSDKEFTGKIGEIGFVAQQSSTGATVFPAKVSFPADEVANLRMGMNGDAEIELAKKDGVLYLPIEAVIDGKVMMPGEKKQQVNVETGLEGAMDVEIKSGLNEGEKVVIQ